MKPLSAEREVWISQSFADRVKDRILQALGRACTNASLLRYYISRPGANEKKARFIMFGLMRSGTTVLGDLLARHPDVTWLGEAYVQRAYYPTLYLNAVARACPTLCVGLKAFSFQLSMQANPFINHDRSDINRGRRILESLRANDWKVIHLTRTDIFAQAVSLTRATQSGLWHQTSGRHESGNGNAVRLDSLEFKLHLEFLIKCRRYEQEIFSGFEMLQLNYEADLLNPENHQAVAERVFGYLGLPAVSVSSNMVKIASERLDAQVENFDELARAAESLGVSPA